MPVIEKLLVRNTGDTENDLAKTLLAQSETEVAIRLEPTRIYSWYFYERNKDAQPAPAAQKTYP